MPADPVEPSAARPTRAELNDAFERGEVPERDQILACLGEAGVPIDEEALAARLGTSSVIAREGLRRRLGAMVRDAQIVLNRKGFILVTGRTGMVEGRIEAHPDGFGFVVGDTGRELFLAPREVNQVFHGDRVLARVSGLDRRGREQGTIVEILERAQTRIVGRLRVEHGVAFVIASDRRIHQDILVDRKALGGAEAGQVVTVEILEQPTREAQPIGRVVEVLGGALDPGMEIEIALRKHQLPFEFSRGALAEARRFPDGVVSADLKDRADRRDIAFVTIDGETARDFDDAVHCERRTGGFTLRVAIADVSHYVREGTALDQDARQRGTSVYFPRRVVPMLPEKLSNGLCSLNPDVDRLAMICEMDVSRAGRITGYRFESAVIRSRARLTYTEVAAALYGAGSASGQPEPRSAAAAPAAAPRRRGFFRRAAPAAAPATERLAGELAALDAVYQVLARQRRSRGAIDFSSQETEFEFDDAGRIAAIRVAGRNEAHRLIEECMLAANVCAAEFLIERGQATLFRNHAGPTEEKLETLRNFLKPLGLQVGGAKAPRTQDYAAFITSVAGRPDASLLEMVLLRSMQQARYAPENHGHFGLAFPAYAHFTSPIRRYPDLLVHRGIRAVLAGKAYRPLDGAGEPGWKALGEHCSLTERRADEASRDVNQWLRCYYMRDRVGETFAGRISAVTSFGIFVTLDQLYVDGLVHISELGKDYFDFDPARYELRGSRTGKVFRLAQRIEVTIARVDLDMARIDFVLAEDGDR